MLTRIYGTAFPSKKELKQHLHNLEEAKKRDHRKLGKSLDLFHFSSIAPGMPFWHPKGVIIWNELIKFWREVQKRYDYQEVKTPELLSIDLFKQSGHYDHYKEFMFFTKWGKNERYVLKPMDCPGEIDIFKQGIKSYKNLPIRFAEIGLVHRKEKKGELNGLFRVSHITQDDAHIFTTEEQIENEITQVIKLTQEIYQPFNLDNQIYLSSRPKNFAGKAKIWDKAEKALKKALEANNISYQVKEGDGAFYGPKIDYDIKDALGRTWQCATIQLDFFMPERFDLKYTNKKGKEARPVIIHRTIMGALERFIGILIEHFAGAFPVWLSPVQVQVIPITDDQLDYSKKVAQKLADNNIRTEIDSRSETMQNKIRQATSNKTPFMLIIGQREVKSNTVSVRQRDGQDLKSTNLDNFIQKINRLINNKDLNLIK